MMAGFWVKQARREKTFMSSHCMNKHIDFCRKRSHSPKDCGEKWKLLFVVVLIRHCRAVRSKYHKIPLSMLSVVSGTRDILQGATAMAEFIHSSLDIAAFQCCWTPWLYKTHADDYIGSNYTGDRRWKDKALWVANPGNHRREAGFGVSVPG